LEYDDPKDNRAVSDGAFVMIIDGQGNWNRFDFLNPRVNERVSAGQFQLSVPLGTIVVQSPSAAVVPAIP
jgi:outer membrane lipoprotein-sorting protein